MEKTSEKAEPRHVCDARVHANEIGEPCNYHSRAAGCYF